MSRLDVFYVNVLILTAVYVCVHTAVCPDGFLWQYPDAAIRIRTGVTCNAPNHSFYEPSRFNVGAASHTLYGPPPPVTAAGDGGGTPRAPQS